MWLNSLKILECKKVSRRVFRRECHHGFGGSQVILSKLYAVGSNNTQGFQLIQIHLPKLCYRNFQFCFLVLTLSPLISNKFLSSFVGRRHQGCTVLKMVPLAYRSKLSLQLG